MTKQQTPKVIAQPLRAGYNSVVPNLEKWTQFDQECSHKRQQQRLINQEPQWRGQVLKQWHQMLSKLHLRPLE